MDNPFNFHHPPISKVPGDTNVKNQYALKDLSKLSRRELLDIENRTAKMLKNKKWINSLSDNGRKIQDLYDRVGKELMQRNEIHEAASLLSSLSLGSNNLNNLEWEGSTTHSYRKPQTIDDDEDPLHILVSSNSVFSNQKIIEKIERDESLVTEQDISEANESENNDDIIKIDPVLEKICKIDNLTTPFRFLPHKSTHQACPIKKPSENSSKSLKCDKGSEVIPLTDSIKIEHKSQKLRQGMLEKQAAERLESKKKELEAAGLKLSEPPKVIPSMVKYRLPPEQIDEIIIDNEENDLSDDTISDEEEILQYV